MSKLMLVTGGAGFVGSNFIRYFLNKYPDYKIVNLDKLTHAGNLDNLAHVQHHPGYTFVQGDIAKLADVKNVFEDYAPEYVINIAAENQMDRSIIDSESFVNTNVLGTQNLLHMATEFDVKKFVQVSTAMVYGDVDEDSIFTENAELSPSTPFAASKAGADLLCQAAFKTYGLNVNIIRSCNNYGPYQNSQHFIPQVIASALAGSQVEFYDNKANSCDWIHVQDHCTAIDRVLHFGRPGDIYNVGADSEWRSLDLVKMILDILQKPHSLIEFVNDHPAPEQRLCIDASKIKNELGWQPQEDFAEGLAATVNWYKAHQEWLAIGHTGNYFNYNKGL